MLIFSILCRMPDLLTKLQEMFPDSSKETLRSMLRDGRVVIAGKAVKRANEVVAEDAVVEILAKRRFYRDIPIHFEDRYLVVVEKPSGLLSVDTDDGKGPSLHSYLKEYKEGEVYPVHRLDREASGLLVFAYDRNTWEALKDALEERKVERTYLAIVEGAPSESQGTITNYLTAGETSLVGETTPDRGKLAITHYEALKYKRGFSLLKVTLETGRKHQIRAHLSQTGTPITGDERYGATQNPVNRLALHATTLSFIHPHTGKRLSFNSPQPEFIKLFS